MNKSDQINELAAALSKVQAVMSSASKDAANPFFKSKYADLPAVWNVARGPITENGLSIAQVSKIAEPIYLDEGNGKTALRIGVIVETVLMHSSGQWISGECYFPLSKNDPQGVGSAITYGRRYGMAAILGIVADEDDDGNSASGNRGEPPSHGQQSNRTAANTAVKTAATKQAAKSNVTNMPTHTGGADVPTDGEPLVKTPEQLYKEKMDQHFGTSGAAFKKSGEVMSICKKLNESGHANKWTFDNLESHVQEGFDKAIKQLDEGELDILIQDLTDIYNEWLAIKNEGQQVSTPTGKQAPAAKGNIQPVDDDPATPNQIDALTKMLDIKEVQEVELMLKLFPDGSKTKLAEMTFGEGKKALTTIGSWTK